MEVSRREEMLNVQPTVKNTATNLSADECSERILS